MGKVIKNRQLIFIGILLAAILFIGNRLRENNYATVPHPGETTDEYAFAWAGLSIIERGIPEAWTGVKDAYSKYTPQKIDVDSIFTNDSTRPAFQIVSPWFDKPPGFALLIGGYTYNKGIRNFVQAGAGILRRPMLKIAILTTILIFLLGARLFNRWVGLLSAFFYSIIPTTVISSRLAMSENGYIPLYLGAILLIDLFLKKKRSVYFVLAAVLAAIGLTFKMSAIAILLNLLVLILFFVPKEKRVRVFIYTFLIGIVGLVAFFVYGYFLNWDVFLKVFQAQSNLFYGASSEAFYSVMILPKIVKFFTDGWIPAAWISFAILVFSDWKNDRGVKFLAISVFSYLIIFLYFGSESYGWYRFPFYPFLIIGMSRLIQKLLKSPNLLVFLPLVFLPFGTSVHKLYGVEGFQALVPFFRIFLFLTAIMFCLPVLIKEKVALKIQRVYMIILILLLTYWSIKEIFFYTYDKWFFVT